MYNYASPLPAPKRQTKPHAELLHVMNSAILCWPIQARLGARARPFDGWTLPKSLWIGQGHI
ncbi:hypothetical protein MPLSOD_10335 [Mesorhizobium sp. SOD10]|nr:hypothetical protein MPLSOD_10335 [Mesorhizobium sp. SOD10]